MLVRYRMSTDVITITPDTTIVDAMLLLRENDIGRLPVVDKKGALVGIVTDSDLSEVEPSSATTLSVFELNYLLAQSKVSDVMTTHLQTISPEALIEEAAILMRDKKIGGLPVVENDKLVGIVTESDIFDSFIELMGFRETGGKIAIEVEDKPHVLATVAGIVGDMGANIANVGVYRWNGIPHLIFRIYKGSPVSVEEVGKKLKAEGYNVTSTHSME